MDSVAFKSCLIGYNHPPRAIRDVRELGIPIITYRVTDSTGRSIAAYKFGNPDDVKSVSTKKMGGLLYHIS